MPLRHLLRKIIITVLVLASYGYFSYLFLVQNDRYYSIVYLLLFYVFVHYFFIDFKHVGFNYFLIVMLAGTCIGILIMGFDNLFSILALIAINIGIIFLSMAVDGETSNRKIISSRGVFVAGNGIVAMFVAIAYALMFVARQATFTLTCDELYMRSSQFTDTISQPFRLGWYTVNLGIDNVSKFKNTIENLSTLSVGDALGVTSTPMPLGGSGNTPHASGTTIVTITPTYASGILGTLESYKTLLVDQVLQDKKSVDKGVCDYMIGQISQRYEHPAFKFSVIVLLFLLLYPFSRLVFFLVSVINVIAFKFLNRGKVYRFTKETEEVEEID